MPRALVVHASLNPAGGAERVALEAIAALQEMGFEVELATLEPTDWARVERLTGLRVRPDAETVMEPRGGFRLYKRVLGSLWAALLSSLRRLGGYRLAVNTQGDVLPTPSDVMYIHFPLSRALRQASAVGGLRRLYLEAYRTAHLAVGLAGYAATRLGLVNSLYTLRVLRSSVEGALLRRASVLYPPVAVEEMWRASETPAAGRRRLVVSCGRYVPEKRLELVLYAAARLRDIEFAVVGSTGDEHSRRYYESLLERARALGLGNLVLLRNLPRAEQLRLYSRARAYLHTMPGEHFGIAVAEAAAAGLVPVVHRSGGAWVDIASRVAPRYGYSTPGEMVDRVRAAVEEYSDEERLRLRRFTRRFSPRLFRARMQRLVARLAG